MTMRLSISSLAGTDRTLVAVGTLRLAAMLTAVRAAAPRSRDVSAAAVAGPALDDVPDAGGAAGRCGGAAGAAGAAGADAGALAWAGGPAGAVVTPPGPPPRGGWPPGLPLVPEVLAGPGAAVPPGSADWPCCSAARAAPLPAGGE